MIEPVPDTGFRWARPVSGDGFELVPGQENPKKLLIVRKQAARFAFYSPLDEETGLFRILADTAVTAEGCLAFANAYGSLYRGEHAEWQEPEEDIRPPVTDVAYWIKQVGELRALIRLWDAAEAEDTAELSCLLQFGKGRPQVVGLPLPEYSTPARLNAYHRVTYIWEHWYGNLDSAPPVKMLPEIARAYCGFVLHERFQGFLNYGLRWNKALKTVESSFLPRNLYSAAFLQLSFAITGNKKYQKCPSCGRWFELLPGVNRANRLTCGQACRTRAYRLRRARAIELAAQGKTAREIAKEVGSDVTKVKQWLTS